MIAALTRLLVQHRPGIAVHRIGAARAFQESEQAGAFAALAMGMHGLVTALLPSVLLPLLQ